ncbi:fibrous sheath CABYR-binding protein [Amia ocellicauda]|uniref:fibrous sheath CABYR-binding protein n=1 Tax=Amia ocellicauda TaxID=2972642 RepID=UPI0034643475
MWRNENNVEGISSMGHSFCVSVPISELFNAMKMVAPVLAAETLEIAAASVRETPVPPQEETPLIALALQATVVSPNVKADESLDVAVVSRGEPELTPAEEATLVSVDDEEITAEELPAVAIIEETEAPSTVEEVDDAVAKTETMDAVVSLLGEAQEESVKNGEDAANASEEEAAPPEVSDVEVNPFEDTLTTSTAEPAVVLLQEEEVTDEEETPDAVEQTDIVTVNEAVPAVEGPTEAPGDAQGDVSIVKTQEDTIENSFETLEEALMGGVEKSPAEDTALTVQVAGVSAGEAQAVEAVEEKADATVDDTAGTSAEVETEAIAQPPAEEIEGNPEEISTAVLVVETEAVPAVEAAVPPVVETEVESLKNTIALTGQETEVTANSGDTVMIPEAESTPPPAEDITEPPEVTSILRDETAGTAGEEAAMLPAEETGEKKMKAQVETVEKASMPVVEAVEKEVESVKNAIALTVQEAELTARAVDAPETVVTPETESTPPLAEDVTAAPLMENMEVETEVKTVEKASMPVEEAVETAVVLVSQTWKTEVTEENSQEIKESVEQDKNTDAEPLAESSKE